MSRSGDAEAAGAAGGVLKYVVPGAVGALSLVLARRWGGVAAGGANAHPPPTGVSRRRRLAAIRDPPLKRAAPHRPPPPPPPSRPHPEEAARPAAGEPPSPNSPNSPKHAPFPNIPQDDDLLFETMMFVFTSLAAGAQFLNLYRTVWWLPHSYTSQTMNFYLIDNHVALFIIVVLGRRLLLSLCSAFIRAICPPKSLPVILHILSIFVLCVIIGTLTWCLYNLFPNHPMLNLFFLCYPISIYFLLFGIRPTPFLQLEGLANRTPHCCANGAPAIRNEVELYKTDYNHRLKQLIFSSLVGAYYASFIPWCFAQHFLHYDVFQIIRHLALVWVGLFTQHAAHFLSPRYCDQLHRTSLHLGRWRRKRTEMINLSTGNSISASPSAASSFSLGGAPQPGAWCHKTIWANGSCVKHGSITFESVGCMTAAEPGNLMHFRFHLLFNNPSNMLFGLLFTQITLILLIFVLLLYTTEWNFILSLAFLLLSNYYTLFKLVRDSFVTWRLYQMESRIMEKTSGQQT